MNDIVNLVVLDEPFVLLLITDVEARVGATEVDLLLSDVGGDHAALRPNLLLNGLDKRNTNLTLCTSHEDLLAKLHR